jgi:hypothetical protein
MESATGNRSSSITPAVNWHPGQTSYPQSLVLHVNTSSDGKIDISQGSGEWTTSNTGPYFSLTWLFWCVHCVYWQGVKLCDFTPDEELDPDIKELWLLYNSVNMGIALQSPGGDDSSHFKRVGFIRTWSVPTSWYLYIPISLFITSHKPRCLWFLYAVLQLGLYSAIVLLTPYGSVQPSDYVFGTTM